MLLCGLKIHYRTDVFEIRRPKGLRYMASVDMNLKDTERYFGSHGGELEM